MNASANRKAEEATGLSVGSMVTDFSAVDLYGQSWSLYAALEKGPVAVIFYRGQWCPVCNAHLKKLQDGLASIQAKGAMVVAVSPERSEFLKRTQEKTGAEFALLYDEGYRISDLFDLTFMPDSKARFMYNTVLGAKLKTANTDDSERLPIPATYIIGTDRMVAWRHFDPDYKKRSSIEEILAHLP
ncbi:MAG: alkyl hydroperoxide reductase [Spirochaetae bacterium HGW-Spirochaetae-7]|jgi:peroxiredoxin|nr:MAG: alkyl hydroperoxide reductase [Spirochaetae bacterium HGW-Spirochaetae-7]